MPKAGREVLRAVAVAAAGGLPYGSPTAPVDFGSGGGGPGFTVNNVSFPSSGGVGGGKIQLTVANTLTVDGIISANGGNALPQGGQAGGGAGGSIYIITEKFAGSGNITADGPKAGRQEAVRQAAVAAEDGLPSFTGSLRHLPDQ